MLARPPSLLRNGKTSVTPNAMKYSVLGVTVIL